MKKIFGIILGIGAILLKFGKSFKFLLVLLKFPMFKTFITMFISLAFYAQVFGWKFGVALIVSLFVHEYGHLLAMKRKKIPTTAAIFIPFMGAVIGMKEKPKDAKTEAFVGIMGPVAGTLLTLACIPLYIVTQEETFILMVYLGAFLNAFNLMPVSPLDGGRVLGAINVRWWGAGIIFLLVYSFYRPNFMIILILFMAYFEIRNHLKEQFKATASLEQAKLVELELKKVESRLTSNIETWSDQSNHYAGLLTASKPFSFRQWFRYGKWKEEIIQNETYLAVSKILHSGIEKMIEEKQEYVLENQQEDSSDSENIEGKETIDILMWEREKYNTSKFLYNFSYTEQINSWMNTYNEIKRYYQTDKATKIKIAASYIGLLVILLTCYQWAMSVLETIS